MKGWNIADGWEVMQRKANKAPAVARRQRWRSDAGPDAGENDPVIEALQRAYYDVLSEPVPARLRRLFTQIERREKDP